MPRPSDRRDRWQISGITTSAQSGWNRCRSFQRQRARRERHASPTVTPAASRAATGTHAAAMPAARHVRRRDQRGGDAVPAGHGAVPGDAARGDGRLFWSAGSGGGRAPPSAAPVARRRPTAAPASLLRRPRLRVPATPPQRRPHRPPPPAAYAAPSVRDGAGATTVSRAPVQRRRTAPQLQPWRNSSRAGRDGSRLPQPAAPALTEEELTRRLLAIVARADRLSHRDARSRPRPGGRPGHRQHQARRDRGQPAPRGRRHAVPDGAMEKLSAVKTLRAVVTGMMAAIAPRGRRTLHPLAQLRPWRGPTRHMPRSPPSLASCCAPPPHRPPPAARHRDDGGDRGGHRRRARYRPGAGGGAPPPWASRGRLARRAEDRGSRAGSLRDRFCRPGRGG